MHKNKKTILQFMVAGAALMIFFGIAHTVLAQASVDFPTQFAGFSSQELKTTIENIVRIVLGAVGIIFLILILYAGFVWTTSAGNPERIERAKRILVSAVIGLLITLASYAIASFIINSLEGAGSGGGTSGPTGPGPGGFGFALGAGVLESHYPGRNATDIPRNTNIFVTFKEPITVDTFCDSGTGLVNVNNVQIIDWQDKVQPDDPLDTDPDNNTLDDVTCSTDDQLTFKLDPNGLIGISSDSSVYRVILDDGVELDDGSNDSALPFGYMWQFTVSTFVDETPPQVTSVVPLGPPVSAGGIAVPRNGIVQINFSEPVDPSRTSGVVPPFNSITVEDGVGPLDGSFIPSNQYRTTEFITNEICGVNSCGATIYCLPGGVTITGTILGTGGAPVIDMAGNVLDGENTGGFPSGDGSPGGDYVWSFDTTNNLDLTPPEMMTRAPILGEADVDLFDPIAVDFNEQLSASTLNSSNIGLSRPDPWTPPATPGTAWDDEINYWVSKNDLNLDGDAALETRALINHDVFEPLRTYHPGANSNITDLFQNCYIPATCGPGPC